MKSKNSIYSLDGVGKVYKFTLAQAFKNKGYRASFIIMIVMIILIGPIMRLGASSSQKAAKSVIDTKEEDVNLTQLFVLNETDVKFGEEDMAFGTSGFRKVTVNMASGSKDDILSKLTNTEALLYITTSVDEQSGMPMYKLDIISSDSTEIKGEILDDLGTFIQDKFDMTRIDNAGVDTDTLQLLAKGFDEKKTYTDKEFTTAVNRKYTDLEVVSLGTTFAVILMMVLSIASSYIVSSVMEEKTSKLVETLMISVRPLALVMGKIFAMMTYVIMILVIGFVGSKISNAVMDVIMGKSEAGQDVLNIDVLFKVGLPNAIIVVSAVIITFLIFAFIAGIAGGSCSKAEDMQSANGGITTLIMIGYMIAMFIPQIDNSTVNHIIVFVPVLSCFVAPVLYIIESITLIELIAFFAINITMAVAMFFICAKVYRKLILIDGSRVKIIDIFKMIFGREGVKTKKEVA
ncbi:MAG: ABC transporter permease [Eubacterium sp.]|nr:ABC transporter permease [Eubacterium sp.]